MGEYVKYKTLVLAGNTFNFLIGNTYGDAYFSKIYKESLGNTIVRGLRNTVLVGFSLDNWAKSIDNNTTIIIFDTEATFPLLKWLARHYNNNRKIFYYRNRVNAVKKSLHPSAVKALGFEAWTYNIHDCEIYDLHYNRQFMQRSLFLNDEENKLKDLDAVFIGYDKGRRSILERLKRDLEQCGAKSYFYIPDSMDFPDNACHDNHILKYGDYIEVLRRSRAVIDIVNEGNYGLTLRPVEAMFMKIKLITNYDDITHYDFYNESNIYIIGKDSRSLSEFLDGEYSQIENSIIEKYDVPGWIKSFEMEE